MKTRKHLFSFDRIIFRINVATTETYKIRIFRHFVTVDKMKVFIRVLLCAVGAFALSNPFLRSSRNTPSSGNPKAAENIPNSGNPTALEKEKAMLELFQRPFQKDSQPALLAIANSYKIEDHLHQYTNVGAVKKFLLIYEHGLISNDALFTVYIKEDRDKAIALFDLFYYAEDWKTFYKSLVWAKFHVNAGLFVYASLAACGKRKDLLQGVTLPPYCQIIPRFFISNEKIHAAELVKLHGFYKQNQIDNVYDVLIALNRTCPDDYWNEEQRISYITDDIGLNEYYFQRHIAEPFWFGGNNEQPRTKRRGEKFLFEHQQLVARYSLERLSNDLGEIKEFTWRKPIQEGCYTMLGNRHGNAFVPRGDRFKLYQENNYFDIDNIYTYESRLSDGIDMGYVLLPNGTFRELKSAEAIDVLGNLIECNTDSLNPRYYRYTDTVFRVFGRLNGRTHLLPQVSYTSILERPETQLHDPVYWQYLNRVLSFSWSFKDNLPPYTIKEISFDEVQIESIDVSELCTYFHSFDTDITNAIDVQPPTVSDSCKCNSQNKGQDFVFRAREWRLRHKPFEISISVTSSKKIDSVVRIFIGPKNHCDKYPIRFNENRRLFFMLDAFKYKLTAGCNIIVRDSRDFSFGKAQNQTSFFDRYKEIVAATNNKGPYTPNNVDAALSFPNSLMIPKGKRAGQTYQIFVHVAPYRDDQCTCTPETIPWRIDSRRYGYPLDRRIDELIWPTSNMKYENVKIFHKDFNEVVDDGCGCPIKLW